jgi:hypothetical protein
MLQGVEAEVGEAGDFFTGGPDAEDTALLTRRRLEGVVRW